MYFYINFTCCSNRYKQRIKSRFFPKSKGSFIYLYKRNTSFNKDHVSSIKPLSNENVAIIELNEDAEATEQLYENTAFIGKYTEHEIGGNG